MKISQMTTEQASDVLVRIMEPIINILKDKEAATILSTISVGDDVESVFAALMRIVPYCLKTHRKDTFEIVGALSGKTEKAVEKQNILQTVRDIMDSIDKDLVDFFKSYARKGSGETEPRE